MVIIKYNYVVAGSACFLSLSNSVSCLPWHPSSLWIVLSICFVYSLLTLSYGGMVPWIFHFLVMTHVLEH